MNSAGDSAQPEQKSERFLDGNIITQAWPLPLPAGAPHPKQDSCQGGLKPENIIPDTTTGTATQDLALRAAARMEEVLWPPVQLAQLKAELSSSPTHGGDKHPQNPTGTAYNSPAFLELKQMRAQSCKEMIFSPKCSYSNTDHCKDQCHPAAPLTQQNVTLIFKKWK
ncbi:hypothetical protein BTVI_53123 [Pitangus sulphuratus]|nr:hypothetical protein BTVI_53123 [Pitangus sulphuratus]